MLTHNLVFIEYHKIFTYNIMGYSQYYKNYYQRKKHIYKARYEEMKRIAREKEEMFLPYNGEKEYYKNKLLEWGVTIIKNNS